MVSQKCRTPVRLCALPNGFPITWSS